MARPQPQETTSNTHARLAHRTGLRMCRCWDCHGPAMVHETGPLQGAIALGLLRWHRIMINIFQHGVLRYRGSSNGADHEDARQLAPGISGL